MWRRRKIEKGKEENILRRKIFFGRRRKRRKLFGEGKLMETPTNQPTG